MNILTAVEVETQVEGGGEDDYEFSHTSVLLQDGDKFYQARTSQRTTIAASVDTSKLVIEPTPIPADHYCPAFSDDLTIALDLTPADCWEKHPKLSSYNSRAPTALGELVLREARIGEILIKHPHPNVAVYHGCIVRGGRITSLCFTRYHQNLVERIYHDPRPFDTQNCLHEIEKGIQHLHSLGIVHNDINPNNIMVTMEDTAVIIDFNSCRKQGEEGFMQSTYKWTDASYNERCAEFENDMCGLRKIRDWLHDPLPFHWMGYTDRIRHKEQGHHGQLGRNCFICGG